MKKNESNKIINFGLIRKIVWSYKKHSKEPFDDLFQEGFIGYLHAIDTYQPNKGAFSTYAWYCVSAKIKDYLIAMNRKNKLLQIVDDLLPYESSNNSNSFMEMLPKESLEIANLIMQCPTIFVTRTQEEAIHRIIDILVNTQGKELTNVLFGIKYLHYICQTIK